VLGLRLQMQSSSSSSILNQPMSIAKEHCRRQCRCRDTAEQQQQQQQRTVNCTGTLLGKVLGLSLHMQRYSNAAAAADQQYSITALPVDASAIMLCDQVKDP
jgi:hypothetical protein